MTKAAVDFVLALVALAFSTYIACGYDPGPLQDFCVTVDVPKHVYIHRDIHQTSILRKIMKGIPFLVIFIIFAFATFIASAYDPSPLQDFCVAIDDPSRALFVNGKFCKDPKLIDVDDFFTSGLNIPGNTINRVGSNVTTVNVDKLPGINTLGVSFARIDYAPLGQNPPHTHPRATEVFTVAVGKLFVGFVTSNQDGKRLFARILNPGDVFVFPIGMIHFQFNLGSTPAFAYSVLSGQNPGTITIGNAIFGSKPPINPEILAKAFRMQKKSVSFLQKRFSDDNS